MIQMNKKKKKIIIIFSAILLFAVTYIFIYMNSFEGYVKRHCNNYKKYWTCDSVQVKQDKIYVGYTCLYNKDDPSEKNQVRINSIKENYDELITAINTYKDGKYRDYTIKIEYWHLSGDGHIIIQKNNIKDEYTNITYDLGHYVEIPVKTLAEWFPKVNTLWVDYYDDLNENFSDITCFDDIRCLDGFVNLSEEDVKLLKTAFPNCIHDDYNSYGKDE